MHRTVVSDETRSGTPAIAGPPFAMSVDVEDYFQVHAFTRWIPRNRWESYAGRVEGNTNRLLDLFDRWEASATFFVLGWVAQRYPELVRRIASRGHEIGSHGMSHRLLTDMTPDEFRAEARDSRVLLEDVAGARVIGFRAPSYSVGPRTLWALGILLETGYEYDSSVYPIRGRRYGYPGGPTSPTRIQDPRGVLAEFPLPTISVGPFRVPVLAGAYLRLLPAWLSLAIARHHRDAGRPLVVNIHPWEIDPNQPLIGPSRHATWTHYAGLHATVRTLERVLAIAPFRSVAQRLRELALLPGDAGRGGVEPTRRLDNYMGRD